MKFTGLIDVVENADHFAALELTPGASNSVGISVQIDPTNMLDKVSGNITVLGSNISKLVGDMVPVKDESLSSGAMGVSQPFVKSFFPYKYIGVQYSANGNTAAGTLTVLLEEKVQRTNN